MRSAARTDEDVDGSLELGGELGHRLVLGDVDAKNDLDLTRVGSRDVVEVLGGGAADLHARAALREDLLDELEAKALLRAGDEHALVLEARAVIHRGDVQVAFVAFLLGAGKPSHLVGQRVLDTVAEVARADKGRDHPTPDGRHSLK